MNVKINIHDRNLDVRVKGLKDWKISEEDKQDLPKFLEDLELGKVNKGKKVSEGRRVKYLDLLKIPLQYWNKPTSELTDKDIETFEKDLSDNLKTKKGTPFKENTKVDIRRSLKIYLKWKLGEKGVKMTEWFDTRTKNKTPDYLTEDEIEKLFKNCRTDENRFLVAVLFDAGCRAEEFLNIRREDIHLPENNENYVKITLKEEYSKTKGRVISLYWKHSLDAVRDYLKERIDEGLKSNEPVFKKTYDNTRLFLNRLGKNVLKKNIYFHLFRHSSATHYSTKLNRQQLCYRYGWKFSSDMPDVYISRSGMESKELDEKFENTELQDLQKQLDVEKQQRAIQSEGFQNLFIEEQQDMIKELIEVEVKKRLKEK